jgi:hypothetical protein
MNRGEREELAGHLRTWALTYARHGWPVLPLAPGTKIPALPRRLGGRGCLDATTDAEVVARMWDRYPLGNIGIRTGELSGLAVLDVDPRHGGEEALAALVAEHGPVPPGPVARTPSGGLHHFLGWREGLRCSAGQLGAGLDVRSDGGYVAAAPSVTDVGSYEWLVHPRTPLSPWPGWLVPTRGAPTKPLLIARNRGLTSAVGPQSSTGEKVLSGLVRTVAEALPGTRNVRLYWSACRLAEHTVAGRVPLDVGAAALLAAAAVAGLPEWEADRTLASALRRAAAS